MGFAALYPSYAGLRLVQRRGRQQGRPRIVMFVSVEVLDDLDREAVLMGPGMELLENGSHAAVGVSGPLARAYRRLSRSIVRRSYPIRRCASASTYRATNDDRFEHGGRNGFHDIASLLCRGLNSMTSCRTQFVS